MPTPRYDLIVIGAGSGGLVAAVGARQLGARVLLVEKAKLGGDCLNWGCVPSKSLIAAAGRMHSARTSTCFGVPAHKEPVNFRRTMRHVHDVIHGIASTHDSRERFESLGIEVLMGAAVFVDAHHIRVGKRTYQGKKILIATGSRPVLPDIPGIDTVPVQTNETIFDIQELPKRLVVLGGGPIGCEIAQAFCRLGSRVSIINRRGLVPREEPEAGALLEEVFREEGIEVYTHSTTTAVSRRGTGVTVQIEHRDNKIAVQGDMLFVALGRTPNIESLELDAAGVAYSPRGVVVNDKLQTNKRHIYAAGDVAGGPQFTHVAGWHGGLVVRNAFAPGSSSARTTALPWVTYTAPEIAHVGAYRQELDARGMSYREYQIPVDKSDRARAEGYTRGFIQVLTKQNGRILGVTIMTPHAGELIAEWALALRKGMKIDEVYYTIHPYPVLAELNKFVAAEHMKGKLTPLLKRFLRWWNRFEKNA